MEFFFEIFHGEYDLVHERHVSPHVLFIRPLPPPPPPFRRACILLSSVTESKLWVIEINPYLETTDGALFSWEHERHLLEGKLGFVFRIVERVKPGAKTMLPLGIKELLQS